MKNPRKTGKNLIVIGILLMLFSVPNFFFASQKDEEAEKISHTNTERAAIRAESAKFHRTIAITLLAGGVIALIGGIIVKSNRDSEKTVPSASTENGRETVPFGKPKRRWFWPLIAVGTIMIILTIWALAGKDRRNQDADNPNNPTDTTLVENEEPVVISEEPQFNINQPLYRWKGNNGKWGFIDKTGKEVIPCEWDRANDFSEGLACVMNSEGKFGYIDKTGQLVISCQLENTWYFKEGLSLVKDTNGKYGFIDKTGQLVIPYKWKDAYPFSESLACVQDGEGKVGFIDKTGEVVIPCEHQTFTHSFSEGLAFVAHYGFIDKTGKLIIPISDEWKDAENFSEGLARVKDHNGKWGFIDNTGKMVIPCQWENAGPFGAGLARVQNGWHGNYGFIDKTGQEVVPFKWRNAGDFSQDLAWVVDSEGMMGFINKTGQLVIPCQYIDCYNDHSGDLILVKGRNDQMHYIDKTGRVVK